MSHPAIQHGSGILWTKTRQSSGVPPWIKSLPFIAMHLACLAALFVEAPPLALALCAFNYFIRMFGITAGYHRYFAHRAYKTSRWFQFCMAWLGCSALQKGPLWWAGHHRGHHRYSDTDLDPHSPHRTSFWWSHVGWILSQEHEEIPWKAMRDWEDYPELRWLDRNHWVPGLSLAVVCFLLGWLSGAGGLSCLIWGFVVSTVILYHGTFLVNSIAHLWGNRRYQTRDDSRNNLLVAIVTLGEGWHNNHHHYQSSANQGFFWWEIDISFYMLKMLSWVGLVWDLRIPGAKALQHRGLQAAPQPPARVEQPVA